VASVLLGVVLEKVYDEDFEKILQREIEKPLRMNSGTQPNVKLLAKGYAKDGGELPPFEAPMSWASVALRYSTEDLLKYASWQVVERDASVKFAHPAHLVDARSQTVGGVLLDHQRVAAGAAAAVFGWDGWFVSVCDLYPDRTIAVVLLSNKAAAGAQETLRRAVREDRGAVAPGRCGQPAFVSRRSAAGSLRVPTGIVAGRVAPAMPLWFMSMLPENWAPSAMPTRGA